MTETPPQQDTPPPGGPTGSHTGLDRDALRDFERLRRSTTDRKIAGVAGGLGRHLNIDPTILRVLFVVLVFFGGAGLLLYGAAWLVVPEEGSDKAAVSTSPGTRTAVLVVAAAIALLLLVGDSWGGFGFPWPLAIVALVVVLILVNKDRPSTPRSGPPPGTPPAPGWDAVQGPAGYGQSAQGWVGDTTTSYDAPVTTDPGYAAPGYDAPAVPPGSPGWAPAAAAPAPRPPKQDRGPRLFGITLAFVALALGVLGLYDMSGGSVVDAAYPALALAVVGVMLVWGSFAGRPGGLIFLGIVASLALLVTGAVDEYDPRGPIDFDSTPQSSAEVRADYAFVGGQVVLDLTGVGDVENLDGRTIAIRGGAGDVQVIVPDDVDVDVDAQAAVGGDIWVDGESENGPSPQVRTQIDGGDDVPDITLDINLGAGSIRVSQEEAA
jgi:phage shock protein PspC (stress-responsive transcriptional regulator)